MKTMGSIHRPLMQRDRQRRDGPQAGGVETRRTEDSLRVWDIRAVAYSGNRYNRITD